MGRANNFDGLRLIAAMAVLLSHMAALGGEDEWRYMGQSAGQIGVLMFFGISGYLVLGSWQSDPSIGRFLERRFLRLAPALVVCVPTTYLLIRALGLDRFPGNPIGLINGSLWTIDFEVYCYLFLLIFVSLTKRPALLALSVVVAAMALFPTYVLLTFAAFIVSFGAAFAVGMLLREYPILFRWWWALAGLGLALMPDHHVGISIIVATLAVVVGVKSWPLLRSAGRYGDLSYGIYIYAYPIQQITIAYLGHETNYFVLLATCLPAIVLCAWLSWTYVEAPALARKPLRQHITNAGMQRSVA